MPGTTSGNVIFGQAVIDLQQEPDGATPLEPEEWEQLIPTWITYRNDLNQAEEENILKASAWARSTSQSKADILTVDFANKLHKRMFGDVWKWAGKYRTTPRNIGIEAYRIREELPMTLGNARYWIEAEVYPPDELAVRLHHSLVSVHPYPNGNGRHARMMADLLIERLGGEAFTWGGAILVQNDELRTAYISALKAADNHDHDPLIAFARS